METSYPIRGADIENVKHLVEKRKQQIILELSLVNSIQYAAVRNNDTVCFNAW